MPVLWLLNVARWSRRSRWLVDGEWENAGTGHTFLKFTADSSADRWAQHGMSWSGPHTSGIDHLEGEITWTHTNSVNSSWHKEYDGRQDYVLAENTTTGANFWRKTVLTESYHAEATATSDYDFTASWNHVLTRDTSYGWDTIELSYNGSLEAHRDETFTSHFDIDSKVTTFNTNGTVASVTGTQTWDRTATGTSTWDYNAQQEHWRNYWDDTYPLLTVTTVDQEASETHALNGSWSKNLSTNVTTTIVNTASTTGSHEFHLTHDEYVGDPEVDGYLDYQNPYDHESTFSYTFAGWWPGISGEHGFTPEHLSTLEHSGAVPGSTGWDIGPQVNPTNNIPYEGPDGVAFEEPEEESGGELPETHNQHVEIPESHRKGPASITARNFRGALGDIPEFQGYVNSNQVNVRGVRDVTLPGVVNNIPGISTAFNMKMAGAGTDMWDREVSMGQRIGAGLQVAADGMSLAGMMPKGLNYADEVVAGGSAMARTGKRAGWLDEAADANRLTKIKETAQKSKNVPAEEGGLNLFKWGKPQTETSTNWRPGDRMLYLPDQGSPQLNWKQNAGVLRAEMRKGKPIYDSYVDPLTGHQIPTRGFLNAERQLLESRGWRYNSSTRAYHPPVG